MGSHMFTVEFYLMQQLCKIQIITELNRHISVLKKRHFCKNVFINYHHLSIRLQFAFISHLFLTLLDVVQHPCQKSPLEVI